MSIKKFSESIYDKYITDVQYIVDVVNSCETVEQLASAELWGKELIIQWRKHETYLAENHFYFFQMTGVVRHIIAVEEVFEKLRDIINNAVQRKNKWKNTNPFLGIW